MDLKGADRSDVVGKRVLCKYDEGGEAPVPYSGVVTYAERGRLHVVFDHFAEEEGAWIDDSDDWSWLPDGPTPRPPPITGLWKPGLVAPPLDKIFLRRPLPPNSTEFYVKWKGMAHIHSQWVPRVELDYEAGNKQRVQRYLRALQAVESGQTEVATWELGKEEGEEGGGGGGPSEDEPYNPDFNDVERVVGMQPQTEDLPPVYLVKWRGLPYASCTWESARTLVHEQTAIRRYLALETPPTAQERRVMAPGTRPPRTNFRKIATSPAYKDGHALRSYQLEGLNWLLFSWYARRSVMLADEMGLGKTIQSVSVLHHIWREEGIRGPFLVLAPLSTLSHWQREFEGWTEMNAVVYHGSAESRELIRELEWPYADAATNAQTRDAYKFHVLITSYEVIKQDLTELRRVPWRYMVIDEAHRLKNKDSALAADLKSLQVEHMHLLSGTPLQNNTTELWALLHFLDARTFPDLDGFLAEYGTLTDAEQVNRLNEKIRPYLLRRQKGDVEKTLVPLDETIVWVEMTVFQKRCYRAVLEGNREILVRGAEGGAAMPSLVNLQMELRKCCNHPYLIKGVEDAETGEMGRAEYTDALLKASGKFVLLDKLLPKLKAEGHRVLIFSQMVKMLDIVSQYLRERRYSHERLDGTIRGDVRQAAIDRFCRPGSETFVFLLSTRAGGLGINLTAADRAIIMDSDWNPQNDVQAMARSHRIGQTKLVKVFRLVTRNTYESEMVERANRKLGLERAMNMDRHNDGLKDGGASSSSGPQNGPPQDRGEIDAMLKRGAHDIFLNDDDSAFQQFAGQDIDEILATSTKIDHNTDTGGGASVFSKAAFIAEEGAQELDMDDPEFWTKILSEAAQKEEEIPDEFLSRKRKEVKRFGMAEKGDEGFDEFEKGEKKGRKYRDGEKGTRRSAATSEIWSKTERMNCERALLSFGLGRWARVKELAAGGTRLREEEEIARFGVAFVCLCCGVPVGAVGANIAAEGADVQESLRKARDLVGQLGLAPPSLTPQQAAELAPYVTEGGDEYARRVHKLGEQFLRRLLVLKRLADAVEAHAAPLSTFCAPAVRGDVGRDPTVPWTRADDAMLLLGVYKHGLKAYEEVRDDPELAFGCLRPGPPLPPFVAIGGGGPADQLPLARAGGRAPQQPAATRPPCFLQEREFRARCQVLLDALLAEGDEAEEREALEAMWEAEWRASAKAPRRE